MIRSAILCGVAAMFAAAQPALARELPTLGPQSVLKCDFNKAKHGTPNSDVLRPLVRGAFTPIPLESVQLVDKNLKRKLMVQSAEAQKTETDTVEVVARLVNCTGNPLPVEARVSFLRDDMAPSEPTSAWRTVFLQPYSTGVYSEKSLARSPAHFLIEVRPGE